VTHLLQQYGLLIVFIIVAAESAGAPLPGETAIVAAGVLASRGHFSLVALAAVASAGAIVGDNIGYWLGRELGRNFLQRYGIVRRFSERFLPPAERFFDKHGGKAIFAARWFSGFRIAGAWIAGFAHMPWWRFLLWNAGGGIAWATTVSVVAYYGGHAAADAISRYGLFAAVVLVVVVVTVLVGVHYLRRSVEERM